MTRRPLTTQDPVAAQAHRCGTVATVMVVLLTVALLGLAGRVVQLTWHPADPLREAVGHVQSEATLLARRGTISDCHGRPLAVSRIGYRLFVDPQVIDNPDTFAVHLAHAIGDDPARLDQVIAQRHRRRFVVIKPLLDERFMDPVRELSSRAIGLQPRLVRHYPAGPAAGQLVGFVGEEHRGLDGVEYMLDRLLSGEDGMLSCLRDARRRSVWINRDGYTPPSNGRDVRLSIDLTIQTIAERALAEAAESFAAQAGELIVMDARNGQLLAMANYPLFDPAQASEVPAAARRNRCVTDPYEPGSIFKPIVWSAITQARLVNPGEKIDCTDAGFYVTSGGRRLHDSHGHGELTWKGVLIKSSNIGMAIAGLRMDAARMHAAVGAFGFGQVTGSGMPGESGGIVNPVNRWNHYSLTSVPMGQEIAVTPLQMVRAFSAFANGGLMATPSFLAAEAEFPIYQRTIDADTADLTRQVLRQVVTEGTGRRANSHMYTIWGKTGTAQVPDRINGGYIDRTYTGSFICAAPLRQPRIVVMAVIHRPDPSIGYYGGTVAGPACKQVVEQTLAYLGVPADNTDAPAAPRVVLAD